MDIDAAEALEIGAAVTVVGRGAGTWAGMVRPPLVEPGATPHGFVFFPDTGATQGVPLTDITVGES